MNKKATIQEQCSEILSQCFPFHQLSLILASQARYISVNIFQSGRVTAQVQQYNSGSIQNADP